MCKIIKILSIIGYIYLLTNVYFVNFIIKLIEELYIYNKVNVLWEEDIV